MIRARTPAAGLAREELAGGLQTGPGTLPPSVTR
jgi:hypothetical protein